MGGDDDFERVLLAMQRTSRRRKSLLVGFVVACAGAVVVGVTGYFVPGYGLKLPLGVEAHDASAMASLATLYALVLLTPPLISLFFYRRLSPEQRRREWALFGGERSRWLRMATSAVSSLSVLFIVVHLLFGAEAQRWSLQPAHIVADGSLQVRTLLTYGLWHADLLHLLLNVTGLIGFGLMVDLRLGRLRTLALCVVAVLAGGAAEAFARAGEDVWIVGSSAAVYAVAVAGLVVMPSRRIATAVVSLPQWAVTLPLLAVFLLVDAGRAQDIAIYAHLAGVVVGAVGGLVWRGLPEPAVFAEAEAVYQEALQAAEG